MNLGQFKGILIQNQLDKFIDTKAGSHFEYINLC
jgi:hypothetical protein